MFYKRSTLELRINTGWKWRDGKDTPHKLKPKESGSGYTYIRQNRLSVESSQTDKEGHYIMTKGSL